MISFFLFEVWGGSYFLILLYYIIDYYFFVVFIIDYSYDNFSYTLLLLWSSPDFILNSLANFLAYYKDFHLGAFETEGGFGLDCD